MSTLTEAGHANRAREQYERRQGRRNEPTAPKTEEDALRQYKRAHALIPDLWDRTTIKQLDDLAEQNGWESIPEYKAKRMERRAEYEKTLEAETEARRGAAAETAAQLTSRQEARTLHQIATDTGDRYLARAIKDTATRNGWNLMAKDIKDYANQLNEELGSILADHDQMSQPWRGDLAAKRVTAEYVTEKTATTVDTNRQRLNDIIAGANQYATDAQNEYDQAYRALTTPTGDSNEQLLAEIRAGKTWDRIQRELSQSKPDALIGELADRVAKADPATLRVLIEEMPSYLSSFGVPNANDLVRAAVDDARPELRDARAQVTAATKLHQVTMHNAKSIENRLNTVTLTDANQSTTGYIDPTTLEF